MCRVMRNFSIDCGLVKNARVAVTNIGTRLLTIQLLHPKHGMLLLPAQKKQYFRCHVLRITYLNTIAEAKRGHALYT